MEKKKAVSPIVSTVLLILIVIVLAAIIFLWSQGFVKEALTKEIAGESKKVDYFCSEVEIVSVINDESGSFGFTNTGNVPIYSLNVQVSGEGKIEVKKVDNTEGGLVNPGYTTIIKDEGDELNYNDYEKVVIIPILLGETKEGGVEPYECPERYGITV